DLASGNESKTPEGRGITMARGGHPPLDEPAHPLPGDVPCVTAPRQRAVPEPAHPEPEQGDGRAVHGHPVVPGVPTDNLTQPCPHLRDRVVQAPPPLTFPLLRPRPPRPPRPLL